MTEKTKIRLVVDEDSSIVAKIDAMAAAEGLARADMLRRAIRKLVFSVSIVPENGYEPKKAETNTPAADLQAA